MSRLEVLLRLSLLHAELVKLADAAEDGDIREFAAYLARLLRTRTR